MLQPRLVLLLWIISAILLDVGEAKKRDKKKKNKKDKDESEENNIGSFLPTKEFRG